MKYQYQNMIPQIDETALIQDGVRICGDVRIEKNVSVWYNSTLRGDCCFIHIQEGSNIQELTSIHNDFNTPVIIGKGVTVGHGCIIHGAIIGDDTLIGMGSTILNKAKIGKNCIVGANSLVTQNAEFEDGMLILGNPARAIRPLKPHEIEGIKHNAKIYLELMEQHRQNKEIKWNY